MALLNANIVLQLGTDRLKVQFQVPEEPMAVAELLPLARGILGQILETSHQEIAAQGKTISCKAGCGACCRQLVPIASAEARALGEVVERMPEPRQTEVRNRFRAAKEKLQAAGLWDKLLDRARWPSDQYNRFGMDYFRQGIPCPFLEDESCSIHPDRPLSCRKYLVTSPPELCANPGPEGFELIRIPGEFLPAMARFDASTPDAVSFPWFPMIMALEVDDHVPEPPLRPGPQLVEEFFRNLTTPRESDAAIAPSNRG